MNLFSVVIFGTILIVPMVLAENKYTNKYDNVDIDKILNNDRVLTNYIRCLMEEGPCTPEGRELKSMYLNFTLYNYFLCHFPSVFH